MKARRVVVGAAVVAGAVAVGVAGWLWLRPEEPRPAAFHGEPTSAFYAAVDSRQADGAPLTAQEVFAPGTETLGALRRTSTEQYTDCDDLLWGVSADGCTQALRTVYEGNGQVGQFVIFNLADGRAADALVTALGKDGFVRQDATFDPARSRAQARAMGHYVTVSWAGGTASADDLVTALVALDGLGRVVQNRILAAT